MRILTRKEKDLIVRMYQYSNNAQEHIDAYQILDKTIISNATKITSQERDNTEKIWLLSLGQKGLTLYSLLRLLEMNGFIRTISRYANENLEQLLVDNQCMPTGVYKQGMDWEIFIYLYDTKIEFLEPFMELAKAKGATLEENLIYNSQAVLKNSESVLKNAEDQTKISKVALWVTIIASVLSLLLSISSIVLSIISLCKYC